VRRTGRNDSAELDQGFTLIELGFVRDYTISPGPAGELPYGSR
jgi:hypothetical protein